MKEKLLLLIILSCMFFVQCKKGEKMEANNKEEILIAEHIYELSGDGIRLKLYKDSTYIFTLTQKSTRYEKIEKYSGKYILDKDTLRFLEYGFQYLDCEKASCKDNFIEFIGGKSPLRLKIKKANIRLKQNAMKLKNKDFLFFAYDPVNYDYFSGKVKPYDLNQKDINEINSLLNLCITENKNRLTKELNTYNKQCIAVMNFNNEVEVLVYCSCKDIFGNDNEEIQYGILRVEDGGNCFFSVKLNLAKKKYMNLNINGSA